MTILRDVGMTLKGLLKQISEIPDENSIVFDSPADLEQSDKTRLSVFLYQVVVNPFLRNIESEPVGLDKLRPIPLTLDLYYIFTPYAKERETELLLLEKVMQTTYDNPVLRGEQLMGSLKNSINNEIRITPNNLTFEEINKLWERFPNKPFKLSASFILTPVKIPSGKPDLAITRVIKKDIDVYRMGK